MVVRSKFSKTCTVGESVNTSDVDCHEAARHLIQMIFTLLSTPRVKWHQLMLHELELKFWQVWGRVDHLLNINRLKLLMKVFLTCSHIAAHEHCWCVRDVFTDKATVKTSFSSSWWRKVEQRGRDLRVCPKQSYNQKVKYI